MHTCMCVHVYMPASVRTSVGACVHVHVCACALVCILLFVLVRIYASVCGRVFIVFQSHSVGELVG